MRLTRIKLKRLERGLLQVEVASRAGVSRARLSEIENGHVQPRVEELERIAGVLGLPRTSLDPGSSRR